MGVAKALEVQDGQADQTGKALQTALRQCRQRRRIQFAEHKHEKKPSVGLVIWVIRV
jgi:hypothetical protein